MISYLSYSDGKVYELKKGKDIGAGAFGKVGEVQGRPDFVYKEVLLRPQSKQSHDIRIKGLYRELWALKKQNLLEGYLHVDDAVIIIMRKVKGNVEYLEGDSCNDLEGRTLASFKALKELNYQGIYHVDPHFENNLIEEEGGQLKARWIDFGFATDHSYLWAGIQWIGFFGLRGLECQSYFSPNFKSARKEVDDQHKLAYYTTMGFYVIAGIGVVSVCGLNSLLVWQYLHSYVCRQIIIELNSLLDFLDRRYIYFKDEGTTERNILRIFKTLINLGYILINFYTLRNLYLNVPNLQIISNLSKSIEAIRRCDNGSLSQLISNGIYQTIIPALNGLSELIKNQNGFAELDKLLAEITYLYMQIGIASKSLASMFEKAPPVNCLLKQMDLTYQYHPRLLFKYAKTKMKERFYGPIEEVNQENKPKQLLD